MSSVKILEGLSPLMIDRGKRIVKIAKTHHYNSKEGRCYLQQTT